MLRFQELPCWNAKGSRKGREKLHAVVLKLCRVERKEEDVMMSAEANKSRKYWGVFFSL